MEILDLHIHSNVSDGIYTPKEILEIATQKKLKGISLTDHDSIKGVEEFSNFHLPEGFLFIPGIEFSCIMEEEEVHLLGYGFNFSKKGSLHEILKDIQKHRKKRIEKMMHRLEKIGLSLEASKVMGDDPPESIGRPHLARAMIEKGYVHSMEEAFQKYLIKGKPGYVQRYRISLPQGIETIKELGGYAVLAHPGLLSRDILRRALSYQLDGIEVFHPDNPVKLTNHLYNLSIEKKLLITGGTDFHELNQKDHRSIEIGDMGVPFKSLESYF